MVLGDLGADVIKVERPGAGDDTAAGDRRSSARTPRTSCRSNRNKRSIALDLQTPEGADAVRRLAARSDVLIENFRPGLMARFGLELAASASANPRLVTCSLTAFGDDAPETARRPGYDIIVQALSGLMSITGERGGEPTKVGVALLDVITGLYAAIGILAALRGAGAHRARPPRGRRALRRRAWPRS